MDTPKPAKRILIIDDDDLLREALADEFEAARYEVLQAGNGRDGLALALKEKPDIILLDQLMPVMSGLDMLKELRTSDWGQHVPVIMATNMTSPDTINEAVDAGANDYFIKSEVTLNEIVDVVNERVKVA